MARTPKKQLDEAPEEDKVKDGGVEGGEEGGGEETPKKVVKGGVSVYRTLPDGTEEFIRTYSGADAKEKAKEFTSKTTDRVVK